MLRKVFGAVREEEALPCIERSLMMCTPHQILPGDQIRKNEMGWACGTDEGKINS